MTHNLPPAVPATAASNSSELEALVALVARLSVTTSEATRLASEATCLATEVHGKHLILDHPQLLISPISTAKLPLALAAAQNANKTTWVRGTPRTPTELATTFPEGSGELWYVVIRGREPGLYRTS